MSLGKEVDYQIVQGWEQLKGNPVDSGLFYDDAGSTIEFSNVDASELKSNAGGYGFWVSKKAAAIKKAQGIPPLGGNKAAKLSLQKQQADSNKQAIAQLSKDDGTTEVLKSLKSSTTTKPAAKNNTVLYVGIGVGVLVLGGVIFYAVKHNKKVK